MCQEGEGQRSRNNVAGGYASADKGLDCMCARVSVHACVLDLGGISVCQMLNLPRSDWNRWIQLGQSGGDCFSSYRYWGAYIQPKSGGSIQSQLVWLYHMKDTLMNLSVFCFLFANYILLFLSFFVIFEPVDWVVPWAGATGCNFLGKRRNSTGEFLRYTYPPSDLDLILSLEYLFVGISNHRLHSGSWHV